MKGIAAHYRESVIITETTCMHSGARACTLVATRAGADRA
jgi:predicted hydrocarbon binding protein